MVLGRFSGPTKTEDVAALIAKKNYTRAIEVIREQLKTQRNDPRLRLQLADVLVSAGKGREAVTILLPLADEFAKEGFAAKAISVLKKIQKIEPGRRDIDARLANVIEEKQRLATVVPAAPSGGALEIGIEEIGFEPPSRDRETERSPVSAIEPLGEPPAARAASSPGPELDLGTPAELDLGGGASPVTESAPATDDALEFDLGVETAPVIEAAPAEITLESAEAIPPPTPAPVVDQDLFTGEFESVEPVVEAEPVVELEPIPEAEPLAEVEPIAEAEEVADPMSDARFAEELFSVLENAFQEAPTPAGGVPGETGASAPAGAQIVVSPLFKDFSVEELVAVIAGLKLLTFERGNVILREGEPGQSLYMLTSGAVKAFVKRDGKQVPIAELEEGAFFGEVSILTGKPRSATIVAKEHCELLELDRPTLDAITRTHPRVWDVLQEFANQRMATKS